MKVAILADIHANIFALQAVIEDFRSDAVDHIIVAGDLVGYYYWPQPVVRLLMDDSRVTCVRGNHENLLKETLDKGSAERHRLKYGSGYDACWETLDVEELDWLFNLPVSVELEIAMSHFSIHHGSLRSVNEYVYPDAAEETLIESHSHSDFTILGNTHFPLMHRHGEKILLNPGSVGQPRDFGGHASYALVSLPDKAVSFKRVPYDISEVIDSAKRRDPKIRYLREVLLR